MTLSNLLSSTPEGRRAMAAAKLRGDVLELLHDALETAGMTRVALATKLGRGKSAVTNALTGDGNLRVNTIAEYLDAMDMDLEISARPRAAAQVARTTHVDVLALMDAGTPHAEFFWSEMNTTVESTDTPPVEHQLRPVRRADYSMAA
ncbi:helix-turn-helix transcriptional regulator [uncultured Nocardioides sp.]|uniref:helix-turn-helix domain-containing protein n=1 Tax=uncultured Nocardioides sp. TaxID=198441 RepID=UPI0026246C39|nr:helix-turn-helix transcriptional regulator [uncultured Nocardioides sp.]